MTYKAEYGRRNRRARKARARESFGNRCGCCGYDSHPEVLEFHHLDPATKEKNLATFFSSKSWKLIVAELRKCVLVCPLCHTEIHCGFRSVSESIERFDESYASYINTQGVLIK